VAATAEHELVERVEALTAKLDALADPGARALADELAASIVRLYGAGLERIIAMLDEATRAALAEDGVVGSLLLIHDLHPVCLGDRVAEGLDSVRPYLASHGGDVELLGVEGGVARLRLRGSCHGCAASARTLERAIGQALEAHAPDLRGLEVEGLAPPPPAPSAAAPADWVVLAEAGLLGRGQVVAAGDDLLLANVAGTLLAYRDCCAVCGGGLHDGALTGGTLRCPGCGAAFDLPRAGRSTSPVGLQLEPVPLLRGAGGVRVAAGT